MSKDKIIICGNPVSGDPANGCWTLAWWLAEDDAVGAYLGESDDLLREKKPPEDHEGWQMWAAQKAASESPGVEFSIDHSIFYWHDEKDVKVALKMVNAALKRKRPLANWEKKALANGWKPPKGRI